MIEQYSFGRMKIDGTEYTSDLKIIKGRVFSGWYRKKGHWLALSDIDDLLTAGPSVIVVGKGNSGRMKVADVVRSQLVESGIRLVALPTAAAAETYNRLFSEGVKVAGAFHLTC